MNSLSDDVWSLTERGLSQEEETTLLPDLFETPFEDVHLDWLTWTPSELCQGCIELQDWVACKWSMMCPSNDVHGKFIVTPKCLNLQGCQVQPLNQRNEAHEDDN